MLGIIAYELVGTSGYWLGTTRAIKKNSWLRIGSWLGSHKRSFRILRKTKRAKHEPTFSLFKKEPNLSCWLLGSAKLEIVCYLYVFAFLWVSRLLLTHPCKLGLPVDESLQLLHPIASLQESRLCCSAAPSGTPGESLLLRVCYQVDLTRSVT